MALYLPSKSIGTEFSQTMNYDSGEFQNENTQYDVTLWVKKRQIVCVQTNTSIDPNGVETTSPSTTSVVEEGYVFGSKDFVVRTRTREAAR